MKNYFVLLDGDILSMTDSLMTAVDMFYEWRSCLESGVLELRGFEFSKKGFTVNTELLYYVNLDIKS